MRSPTSKRLCGVFQDHRVPGNQRRSNRIDCGHIGIVPGGDDEYNALGNAFDVSFKRFVLAHLDIGQRLSGDLTHMGCTFIEAAEFTAIADRGGPSSGPVPVRSRHSSHPRQKHRPSPARPAPPGGARPMPPARCGLACAAAIAASRDSASRSAKHRSHQSGEIHFKVCAMLSSSLERSPAPLSSFPKYSRAERVTPVQIRGRSRNRSPRGQNPRSQPPPHARNGRPRHRPWRPATWHEAFNVSLSRRAGFAGSCPCRTFVGVTLEKGGSSSKPSSIPAMPGRNLGGNRQVGVHDRTRRCDIPRERIWFHRHTGGTRRCGYPLTRSCGSVRN